jgi:serine/threonine protein kinase
MADSLFDNRYRYDYIYPRGRSGETLRALDTLEQDRLVVIKRPAPNDAPPIRAGQEVSILNERKALQKVAGHPVATALLGSGQFLVGGVAHQYIVMERAPGVLLADIVRDLAQREERLPELEMLVIVEGLLDLLQTAHSRDIVYNDVDAKHLFWDRDAYKLKLIDWGNAVFLEGDEMTPQGISRQTDVFQVGELLYFIVTGGGRAEIPRDAGDDFVLHFGRDDERLSPRLKMLISRAAHPNARFRTRTINDLRRGLNEYREPLERERNTILGRVSERLKQDRSKDELTGMLAALQPALASDPGHPQTRTAFQEIQARIKDLDVEADLDAARIYLESGNWARAVDLLDELRERSRNEMQSLSALLLDFAQMLLEARLQPVPQVIFEAVGLLFEGHNAQAANLLVTSLPGDHRTRAVQWLLAERVSAHTPDILLLRPNLYRLETALAALATEGLTVTEARAVIAEINTTLEKLATSATNMVDLRDGYRSVVDGLTALSTLVETINRQHNLPDRRLPVSALERAGNAAMALADNMHVIGRQATASPRDALNALDNSRTIDPTNTAWDGVERMLRGLYELLQSYQVYVPAADGSDLADWLENTKRDLLPFRDRLFDNMLLKMISGLDVAAKSWAAYAETTIQGNRGGSIDALSDAITNLQLISPTLANWLSQVRAIIQNAQYVERHALYGGLGRALADGWEAYDRARLTDAERLGQQAVEIARTDAQRFAADRLRELSKISRDWLERNGVQNVKGTQTAFAQIEALFTKDEQELRSSFAAQMPTKETYLKAMGKGLLDLYGRSSTAAPHILFAYYIMLGVLDAHEGMLEDADFWREAAERSLGEYGARHGMTRALAEFVDRRRALNTAGSLLDGIHSFPQMALLESARKQLEENAQARVLTAGIQSLRELENATRDWADGEFRAAGIKLENAMQATTEVEQQATLSVPKYRAWLMELLGGAAELHNQLRTLNGIVENKPAEPDERMRLAFHRMVDVTNRLLGDQTATTVRGWRDTYEQFLAVYTDMTVRRSERLNRFNQLFRAMFIDRHPAYPLFRHWYDVTDASPEFPAPPTSEPTPRLTTDVEIPAYVRPTSKFDDDAPPPRRPLPIRGIILALVGLALLLGIGFVVLNSGVLGGTNIALTITATPTSNTTATQRAILALSATAVHTNPPAIATLGSSLATPTLLDLGSQPTSTVIPSRTAIPTLPPPILASPTLTVSAAPSNTPLPTDTLQPSITPSPTLTPTATLPATGLQGEQDLLALFERLGGQFPWSSGDFAKVEALEGTYWRLGSDTPDQNAPMLVLALPAELLDTYYGNNAAARIRRMEVEITLTTFNPTLIDLNEVYFGALLQAAQNPIQSAGLNIRLIQTGVLNVGQREGDTVTGLSNQPASVYVARIRLERDPNTGTITTFYNGEQLGTPLELLDGDAALLPTLFVRRGDVVVSVTEWTITLR